MVSIARILRYSMCVFTESKLLSVQVKSLKRHPVKSEEKNKVRSKESARTPCIVSVLRN